MQIPKKDLDIIISELKDLASKDAARAIKVEHMLAEIIKVHPEKINDRNSPKGLVRELYEDLRMRDDLDKTNSKKVDTTFLKKTSRIGRIDRKKAWHNMLYHLHKKENMLNSNELSQALVDIEQKITLPEDYDVSQTAKLRDEYVFIKDGRLQFHVLENSQDVVKRIGLRDNLIIILGKNLVYKINLDSGSVDGDNPNTLGLMPIDCILYVSGQFVFIWKR